MKKTIFKFTTLMLIAFSVIVTPLPVAAQETERSFGIFNGKLNLEGNNRYFVFALFGVLGLVTLLVVFLVIKSIIKERKMIQKFEPDELAENELSNEVNPDAADCAAVCEEECLHEETEDDKKPVIRVKNVSMNFRVTTSNVSGIKEYIIQKMKHQIKYRDFLALDNISFDVFKGEVVGIIGTNGSGKSTLLKIISGALSPTNGKVEVERKKIQILTLGTGFDMELTARENVYLNGSIIGYTKDYIDANYEKIVEFAELEGFMEEKVKNFSSGMVSRLGFAIATCGEAAEILILDEVLSVGDEFFRQKSLKRIKEMIHGGSTVLMVSHSMNTIIENCTKVVWIEKGKLRVVGPPNDVCVEYKTVRS